MDKTDNHSRYKVTISEEVIAYLVKDSRKRDPKKLTKLGTFSLLCSLTYLQALQGESTGIPASNFEVATKWSRPITVGFLNSLEELGVICSQKEGKQRIVALRPEIFSLSGFAPRTASYPSRFLSAPLTAQNPFMGPLAKTPLSLPRKAQMLQRTTELRLRNPKR